MNIESVKSLFNLFSDEEYSEKYAPIISLAFSEVEKMLVPNTDTEDVRLDFLCAAIANYRVQQIKSATDRSEYTYAGKMESNGKTIALSFAENLVKDYYQMCKDLISPQTFIFMSFSSKEEI